MIVSATQRAIVGAAADRASAPVPAAGRPAGAARGVRLVDLDVVTRGACARDYSALTYLAVIVTVVARQRSTAGRTHRSPSRLVARMSNAHWPLS